MIKQQVYIYPGSDHVFQALLDDARNVDGIQIVDSIFSNNYIESKILQTKSKHKYLWKLFGQQVLKHHVHNANGLKNIKVGSIVVFSNISVRFLPVSFLKKLKNQGIKLVVYFIDSISNINAKEAFRYVKLGMFDAVFTFDKEDAKRYGFTHFYTMYSRHYNFPEADSIDYDAVYIGSDKGRYNMLTELKAKCQHANLYIDMLNISEKQLKDSEFQSNKSIRYVDSLKIVGENVSSYLNEHKDSSVLMITHYPRLLEYIKPDYVHIMVDGKIVKTGDYNLAVEIENDGYEKYKQSNLENSGAGILSEK